MFTILSYQYISVHKVLFSPVASQTETTLLSVLLVHVSLVPRGCSKTLHVLVVVRGM